MLGEGGENEYVIPESRLGGRGGVHVNLNVSVHSGEDLSDQAVIDAVARKLRTSGGLRRLVRQSSRGL